VAAGATGAWAGQAGRIALMSETGWQFTQALPGWRAHVLAEGQTAVFDGLVWETPSESPLTVPQLGVAATADAVNRLTVAAPATLLNHAGSGHQLKLNKAAAGDTASLLFQTGFGGRAEMGTAGGDDFSVKVSADGSAWFTALEADAATGEVKLHAPLHLGGQPADPASPADGTLWLNTTTGEVKVQAAGLTLPLGGGGGVSDGDKGEITVTGGGAIWTVDPGAITLAKLANIPTDSFLGRDSAGIGMPETLTAAQARGILNVADGATANAADAALRDRASHTGTQASATISDFVEAVDDRVAAFLVAGPNVTLSYNDAANALTIAAAGGGGATNLSYDNATRVLSSDTGADATLPLVTSGNAGLAPASGGGTDNFLRADGTWAAPAGGGGGVPGGALGEVQFNSGGAFAGAADVQIEGGQLRLPAIANPATPAAGGLKLFGREIAGRHYAAVMGPSGLDTSLQPLLGRNKIAWAQPNGNSTVIGQMGLALSSTGTATAKNWASTRRYTRMRGIEYLMTTASTSAIAGWRGGALQYSVGGDAAGDGGFSYICRWGPATGVAIATTRAFVGLVASAAAPSDASNPSVRTNQIGMGWDLGDANVQIMHNDGSGASTRIDLGVSFPRPTEDRTQVYELALFSPPGPVQSVTYEVTNLNTGETATGTITTDLPSTATGLNAYGHMSVGGTSSVVGICLFSVYIETDY
jgi:hypothetical protein